MNYCSTFAASNNNSSFTRITPLSGVSRKFRQRRSVVFPLPEEPIKESTCPRSNEKLISFNTSVRPNQSLGKTLAMHRLHEAL